LCIFKVHFFVKFLQQSYLCLRNCCHKTYISMAPFLHVLKKCVCSKKKISKFLSQNLQSNCFFSFMHCTIVLVQVTFPWNLFVAKVTVK
jgi:hypothetical protein